MFSLALRNVWERKRRLTGTFFAVCLGVAFLSGTLLLSDTLRANFSTLFTAADAHTDVVIRGATTISNDNRQNTRNGVAASLLAAVQQQPGVAHAEPSVQGYGLLLGSNGKGIGGNGPPTRAGNWITDPALNPYRLVAGRAPRAADEVVVNRGAAKTGHLHVGDTTIVETPTPVPVHIVGIATFGSADGFGPATFVGFTLPAAEHDLSAIGGQYTEILVRAAPGTAPNQLAARLRPALPSNTEAITGSQLTADSISQVNRGFLTFLRGALLAFSLVAFLVAAFSIHNTLAILAAQRRREAALLRAVGASRRQILGAAVAESAVVGAAGSLVGLGVGVLIAGLLKGMFDSFGFALPAGGLALRPTSLAIAAAAGIVVTLGAGKSPAIRSSGVAPLAAIRAVDGGSDEPRRSRRRIGVAVVGAGLAALLGAATFGHASGNAGLAGLGAILLLVGIVVIGPFATRPVVGVVGWPIARLRGVTGQLARDNAARQPRRTAGTAAALLVGVTVVSLFTVVAASLQTSLTRGVEQTVAGDLVVGGSAFGGGGVSPALAADIARLPAVQSAAGIGKGSAPIAGHTHKVTVADPVQLAGLVDLHLVAGTRDIGKDGVAVSSTAAAANHWRIGSVLPITYPDGSAGHIRVGALYTHTALVGDYLLAPSGWLGHAAQAIDAEVLVQLRPGVGLGAAKVDIARIAGPYGQPAVQDRHQFVQAETKSVNTMLGMVYALLFLAILIALMGIANTLSLAIHERTRELGLLRAVGQSRRQARSLLRWESVIVAVFGTVGGVAAGVTIGWALVRSLSGATLSSFAAPPVQLVAIVVVGGLAGVLAAVRPARRAARIDLLQALAAT